MYHIMKLVDIPLGNLTQAPRGCDKVVLLVKVALEESQVAGGGFHYNLLKNWSGEKMCLVGIWVDCSLGVSVFSIGCSRRRYLAHETPRTLMYHRHQLQVLQVGDFGQYTACL